MPPSISPLPEGVCELQQVISVVDEGCLKRLLPVLERFSNPAIRKFEIPGVRELLRMALRNYCPSVYDAMESLDGRQEILEYLEEDDPIGRGMYEVLNWVEQHLGVLGSWESLPKEVMVVVRRLRDFTERELLQRSEARRSRAEFLPGGDSSTAEQQFGDTSALLLACDAIHHDTHQTSALFDLCSVAANRVLSFSETLKVIGYVQTLLGRKKEQTRGGSITEGCRKIIGRLVDGVLAQRDISAADSLRLLKAFPSQLEWNTEVDRILATLRPSVLTTENIASTCDIALKVAQLGVGKKFVEELAAEALVFSVPSAAALAALIRAGALLSLPAGLLERLAERCLGFEPGVKDLAFLLMGLVEAETDVEHVEEAARLMLRLPISDVAPRDLALAARALGILEGDLQLAHRCLERIRLLQARDGESDDLLDSQCVQAALLIEEDHELGYWLERYGDARTSRIPLKKQRNLAELQLSRFLRRYLRREGIGGYEIESNGSIYGYEYDRLLCFDDGEEIVVEFDGPGHERRRMKDAARDRALGRLGIRTLRVSGDQLGALRSAFKRKDAEGIVREMRSAFGDFFSSSGAGLPEQDDVEDVGDDADEGLDFTGSMEYALRGSLGLIS